MILPHRQDSSSTGLTLIEVTLVVAVLIGLVSILFIGVASYKEGTNRARCILTIATVQKAVRSFQNLNELEAGDSFDSQRLVGDGRMLESILPCGSQEPTAASAASKITSFDEAGYFDLGKVPAGGVPFLSCKTTGLGHVPKVSSSW